jgi:hypothetical protein
MILDDLEKLLFKPKTFFTEKRDCGWKEPFYFFIITLIAYSVCRIILSCIYYSLHPVDAFPYILNIQVNPVLLVLFLSIWEWLQILGVLWCLIILMLYLFRCNVDYFEVFKVLLFTHVLWLAVSLLSSLFGNILIILSNISFDLGLIATPYDVYDVWMLFPFLFQVIGFSWVTHRTIIGVTTFFDIPYKKGIILVGLPCIIILYPNISHFIFILSFIYV